MKNDYLERILRARVYDVAVETPLEVAPNLSARLGNRVLLKREDMQPVFSFKCRGAYNKMANLSAAALARGVIASSAGNHAQGVALAAQQLGCAARLDLVRIPLVADEQIRERHPHRMVLHLPDVAQLVAKQFSVCTQLGRTQQDQIPHRVGVEAAKPRQEEKPADGPDPDPFDLDWALVECERVETCLGSPEQSMRLGLSHCGKTSDTGHIFLHRMRNNARGLQAARLCRRQCALVTMR